MLKQKKTARGIFSSGFNYSSEDPNLSFEQSANLYILYCFNYALIALVLMWILNVLNIFIVDRKLMTGASIIGAVLLILPKVICHIKGSDWKWLKLIILVFSTTAIAVYGVALSYHATLLFAVPMLFAAQYQNRRIVIHTYIYDLFTMLISILFSYNIGVCDLNMLFLSSQPSSFYVDFATGEIANLVLNGNPFLTIPLFFFFPRAVILFVLILIMRNLLNTSSESAVILADLRRVKETDKVTRFYNKAKLDKLIATYYNNIDEIGVIYWGITNLKITNEKYGHSQGDILISSLAGCISEMVLNMRHVFRVGGDEFVMIIEEPKAGEVEDIVEAVRLKLDQRNASSRIAITAAVGWATGTGENTAFTLNEAACNMNIDKGQGKVSEVPTELKDSILTDRLFDGFASISENVYIYICDMKTNMSRWSLNAVDYFDMPGEYMSNINELWLSRIHPEDRRIYEESIQKVFSGETVNHKCEYRVKNRHGEYVWLECRGSVIYDENRQTRFFSGVMQRMDNRNKYDPLTKLLTIYEFNKYRFENKTGSLMLIGLDDFRMVINNYGYHYGDVILAEFARRLVQLCGEDHVPFRMEGDEFLILSVGADRESTRNLFSRVNALGRGLGRGTNRLTNIHFSGGAVLFPDNGSTREELIGNLEHSLEMAKKEYRGELVFFHDEIAEAHQRVQIINDYISKISRDGFGGFNLFFQPIVSSSTHEILSCEALLRCNELADKGIGIEETVDRMERSGDIIAIGNWVADQVFRRAQRWQKKYPKLNINFNISAVQIQNPGFVQELIQMSLDYKIDQSRIIIEITESSEIDDFYTTAQYLTQLRDFGFKIALDDFGIAYSTLMLIKALPADYVKIDHSFVLHLYKDKDQKDLAIIEAVIDLCRKLNIQVVAEGVENIETIKILEAYPIDLYQGYHFSRPLSEESFIAMLDEEKNSHIN